MSLKELVRTRIMQNMIKPVTRRQEVTQTRKRPTINSHVALIVDSFTLRIVSSCCTTYELLECGVSVVESIHITRQPLPQVDCIYFVSPDESVVKEIIRDFSDEKKPMYRDVHICFSGHVATSSGIFERIAKPYALMSRVKTIVNLDLNFIPYESRVFHLDKPNILNYLYSRTDPMTDLVYTMAEQIKSVALLLSKSVPKIRFVANDKKLSTELAKCVESRMGKTKKGSVSSILILDRSIDITPVLIHEFTYQALAYDLIPVPVCVSVTQKPPPRKSSVSGSAKRQSIVDEVKEQDDLFEYEFVNNKNQKVNQRAVLSEQDELWSKHRHQHITYVNKAVKDDVFKFAQSNSTRKLTTGDRQLTPEETRKAIQDIPEYQEMLNKFWVHVTLSEKCVNELTNRHILELGQLEQAIATGVDSEGGKVSVKKLVTSLANTMANPDFGPTEKIRLLLLYFANMVNFKPEEQKHMVTLAQLSHEDSNILNSLINLNLFHPFIMDEDSHHEPSGKETKSPRKPGKHAHQFVDWPARLRYYKGRAKSVEFVLSRYEPLLKEIIEKLIFNKLHKGFFPLISEPKKQQEEPEPVTKTPKTLLRATNQIWDWGVEPAVETESLATESDRDYVLIFVIGGITFSEMRVVYEAARAKNVEIYIGGSSIITAGHLINEQIREISKTSSSFAKPNTISS